MSDTMTVITQTDPLSLDEVQALSAAEQAGKKIEGYIGFVATCHIVAAYEKAITT